MGLKFCEIPGDHRDQKARDVDRRDDFWGIWEQAHLPWPLYFLVLLKEPLLRRPSPIEVLFLIGAGRSTPVNERLAISVRVVDWEVVQVFVDLSNPRLDVFLS